MLALACGSAMALNAHAAFKPPVSMRAPGAEMMAGAVFDDFLYGAREAISDAVGKNVYVSVTDGKVVPSSSVSATLFSDFVYDAREPISDAVGKNVYVSVDGEAEAPATAAAPAMATTAMTPLESAFVYEPPEEINSLSSTLGMSMKAGQ